MYYVRKMSIYVSTKIQPFLHLLENHFDVESVRTPSKLCKVYQRNRWRYNIRCNIGLGNMYVQTIIVHVQVV
jgi:hypothetical protein